MPTASPGKLYDLVSPRLYKKTNGHVVPRLNQAGKRTVPLVPPTEGADTFYDPVSVEIYKEKDTSFRFDKAARYNDPVEKEFGRDRPAAKYYTLPRPEVYKERLPSTPAWRKGPSRFGYEMKPQGADALYDPVPTMRRTGNVPNLSGGGPRLDDKMYMRGAGAEVPFYDLPHPTVYKERSHAFRFARDVNTGADPVFLAVPEPNKIDPDAPVPQWVQRLAAHNPRPVRPFLREAPKKLHGVDRRQRR